MTKENEILLQNYILNYASKHHISIEETKEHLMVKLVERFYKGEKNDTDK